MTTTEINDDLSWCTEDFLETALQKGGLNPNNPVTDFKIEKATASGDNYLSEIFRVQVKIRQDSEENETSIIIKSTPTPENVKQMISEHGFFEREICMFTKVLPQFHSILQEVAPEKYQPFGAKCFHNQDIQSRTFIVLEDLKAQGFRMAERLSGFDLQHAQLALRRLGRFHALSVVLHRRDPQFVEPFRERFGLKDEAQRKMQDDYFAVSLRSLADEIDTWPDMKSYPDRLRKVADNCKGKVYEITKTCEEEFTVLNHGDFWLNNMMFKYDDKNQPQDIRFVDFQMSHWTSPAIDLHYFLNTSLSLDMWDKKDYLLGEYHKELCETLRLFNLQSIQPTFQELQNILKKRDFFSFYVATLVVPFVLKDPNNIVPVKDLIPEKGQEVKAEKSLYTGSVVQRALKTYLPIMAEKGLF